MPAKGGRFGQFGLAKKRGVFLKGGLYPNAHFFCPLHLIPICIIFKKIKSVVNALNPLIMSGGNNRSHYLNKPTAKRWRFF